MVMPKKPAEEKVLTVSFALYSDDMEAIIAEAKKRRIPRSQLLREIVREWIRQRQEGQNK